MGLCNPVGVRCVEFMAKFHRKSPYLPLISAVPSRIPLRTPLSSAVTRHYATSDSLGGQKTSSRKQVTIRNDDGRVQWKELTTGEKAARTTQQTFNFGVIFAGLCGTVRKTPQYLDLSSYETDCRCLLHVH